MFIASRGAGTFQFGGKEHEAGRLGTVMDSAVCPQIETHPQLDATLANNIWLL